MDRDKTDKQEKNTCSRCAETCRDETYIHQGAVLCEDCYMDAMNPRTRKTHWQYISSVKYDYLDDK